MIILMVILPLIKFNVFLGTKMLRIFILCKHINDLLT